MELIRKILLAIEEQYIDVALFDITVEDYNLTTIAYHCKILHDAGLISEYEAQYGDDHLLFFGVGSLTWEGHEFLDSIRDNTVWTKTKEVMKDKGLPFVLDTVKQIASAITTATTQAVVKSILS